MLYIVSNISFWFRVNFSLVPPLKVKTDVPISDPFISSSFPGLHLKKLTFEFLIIPSMLWRRRLSVLFSTRISDPLKSALRFVCFQGLGNSLLNSFGSIVDSIISIFEFSFPISKLCPLNSCIILIWEFSILSSAPLLIIRVPLMRKSLFLITSFSFCPTM